MGDDGAEDRPIVSLVGVTQRYQGPPEVLALRATDLVIRSGDFVAIMGPSGSGKSTLVDIIALLRAPSSGEYWLAGENVADLTEKRRAAARATQLGVVFQSFHLLAHRTALDNVALAQLYRGAPPRARRSAATAALDQVHMSHRHDALPLTLSGGEQQRVAVARAIVNRPQLLLCDEPTGNLDSGNSAALLDLLDHLHASGMTLLLITHSDEVAARAQRHLRLFDGVLTEVSA